MNVRFERFTLDSGSRQLLHDGQPVHLTRKAFDLLCILIERCPNVVSKTDLHAEIWPGVAVTDASLNVLVREIRHVIGDDAEQQRFIRTVSRVGYAFCGTVVGLTSTSVAKTAPDCWLRWLSRTLPLEEGENILGRGAGCSIIVDDDGVSRRHASIHLDNATKRATIEDLRSMNGTYVGRSRVK